MTETPVRTRLPLKKTTISIPPSPLMRKLGYGTGVTVYKLDRPENRSPWVLKKLSQRGRPNQELNNRLHFEANILRKLNHPNIVGFRAFLQESDGRKCIALEHCSISLGDLIEARAEEESKPFPVNQIEKVIKDISKALHYLHNEAQVLHCDIKSYNILIKNDFEICKLCDFGVSMPLNKDGTLDEVKAGENLEYVGTEPWCAPEILQIGQIITVKADIFAFGLCIWEMIALEPPYSNLLDDSEIISVGDSSDEENIDIDTPKSSKEKKERVLELKERPELPTEHLTKSYLPILQVFTVCTEQDYKKRPNAEDLCLIIKDLDFSIGKNTSIIDLTDSD